MDLVAARVAVSSCSSACPTRLRIDDRILGGHPRFRCQSRRTLNRPYGAKWSSAGTADPCGARKFPVEPQRVGFVETHGTGTVLGDPIEVEAIASTFGKRYPNVSPCLLGSVKANIGHLEAAAGVIGLIKAVLALRHEAVPPQIHFNRSSIHISLSSEQGWRSQNR